MTKAMTTLFPWNRWIWSGPSVVDTRGTQHWYVPLIPYYQYYYPWYQELVCTPYTLLSVLPVVLSTGTYPPYLPVSTTRGTQHWYVPSIPYCQYYPRYPALVRTLHTLLSVLPAVLSTGTYPPYLTVSTTRGTQHWYVPSIPYCQYYPHVPSTGTYPPYLTVSTTRSTQHWYVPSIPYCQYYLRYPALVRTLHTLLSVLPTVWGGTKRLTSKYFHETSVQ